MSLKILITVGPTREPIDPVRYIGNRSSGKMGAALAQASIKAGYQTTLILGPVSVPMPPAARSISVETAAEMMQAVLREFPGHDLLIMAAAVSDFRPKHPSLDKIPSGSLLSIELEPTADILAAVGRLKRPDQRTVGFSLQTDPDLAIARKKLLAKNIDLIVYNPAGTLSSPTIAPTLIFADGSVEKLSCRAKEEFADNLLQRAAGLFPNPRG